MLALPAGLVYGAMQYEEECVWRTAPGGFPSVKKS